MLWQSVLASIDIWLSETFRLASCTSRGTYGHHTRMFYLRRGKKRVGIVGVDGRIHTITGYNAVIHEYSGSRLLRRVLVRKNFAKGERLATEAELKADQERTRKEMESLGGMTDFG